MGVVWSVNMTMRLAYKMEYLHPTDEKSSVELERYSEKYQAE